MAVAIYEQETTINTKRDSDIAQIYTSDPTVMTRLDKSAKSDDCTDWKLVKEIYDMKGELVGKMYETNKRLVSYRSFIQTKELTDEQKEANAENLRLWRERQRAEKAKKTENG